MKSIRLSIFFLILSLFSYLPLHAQKYSDPKIQVMTTKGKKVTNTTFKYINTFNGDPMSPFAVVRTSGNNYQALMDSTGKVITPYKYDRISEARGIPFFSVSQDNKVGFIDFKGKEVIPCIYDGYFDVDAPGIFSLFLDDKMGLRDTLNTVILPFEYSSISYYASKYLFSVSKDNKTWALANRKGEILTAAIYSKIETFEEQTGAIASRDTLSVFLTEKGEEKIAVCGEITNMEGLLCVKTRDGYRFYNYAGEAVTDYIRNGSPHLFGEDGLAPIGDGNQYFIDTLGNFLFSETVVSADTYSPSYFSHGYLITRKGNSYGVINKKGEETIPFIHYGISTIYSGPYFSIRNKDWKYALFTADNKQLTSFEYDDIHGWEGDSLFYCKRDGLRGKLDKTGKEVIPCRYDEVQTSNDERVAYLRKNKKIGFANLIDGTTCIEPKYDKVYKSYNGYCPISIDAKWGVFSIDEGKEIIACTYKSVTIAGNDTFIVENEKGEYALINKKEKIIIPYTSYIAPFYNNLVLVYK